MTDLADAQHLIAHAQQQADHACMLELHELLQKHQRRLIVTNIGLTPQGWLQPEITLAPLDPTPDQPPPPSFPQPPVAK